MTGEFTNIPINEIIILQNDKKSQIKSSDYLDSGKLPIVDQSSNLICGYTNDLTKKYSEEIPVIVFGDHTLHLKYIDFEFSTGADGTQILRPLNRDDFCKYLFYVILRETQIMGSEGYKRHLKILRERLVPYSNNYTEQRKIASILTSVDEVIENTQKQIEKLRDLKKATMNELLTKGIGHTEFRDSELGRIPKSWKVRSLEDVCLKIQDGTHFSPTLNGGDFKYITSKNIRMGEINLADVETISRNEHEKIYKRCDVKIKDLLLTKDGANTGNIAMNTLDEEFSLLSSVAFLRPSEQVNGEYLLQFMMSEKAQNQIAELMSGNAIRRLTLAKIRKFKVVFPGCEEQRQIASILSSTDKRLKYLRRKSLKTQFLKKSLMQDLLTGKVRVKVN